MTKIENHMFYHQQKEKLARIARRIAEKHSSQLEQLKKEHKELERPDFIWHFLLQSFSTMGRAAGWHGLIKNKENYSKVTFDALAKLEPDQQDKVVRATCDAAKVRWPDRKTEYIVFCKNFFHKVASYFSIVLHLQFP